MNIERPTSNIEWEKLKKQRSEVRNRRFLLVASFKFQVLSFELNP